MTPNCAAQITVCYFTHFPEEQLAFTHLSLSHPFTTTLFFSVGALSGFFFLFFPDDFGLNHIFVHNWTICERCSGFVMYFRRLQLRKHPADDACRACGRTRTLFEKKNMSPPPPLRAVTGMRPCNRTNLSINRALNSRQVAASA